MIITTCGHKFNIDDIVEVLETDDYGFIDVTDGVVADVLIYDNYVKIGEL